MLAVGCALAALMIGCGGGESSPSADTSHTPPPARTQVQTQTQTTASTVEEPPTLDTVHHVAPNPLKQPRGVSPHRGFRLDHLVVRDLVKGHGPAARPHDYVYMDYIEADYRRGLEIYRAWGHGQFGTAGVILAPRERWRGMVKGVTGMRVGGHRRILVPPKLAGIEPGHMEYGTVVYWDVVLRKILARGCSDDGRRCRSVAS